MIRTFIDSGVLIAALRGTPEVAARALAILDDPQRVFVTSDLVALEILPKAVFHRNDAEVEFYEAFLKSTRRTVRTSKRVIAEAHTEACASGLSAIDALHVAAAKAGRADELVTAEKPTKPIFRASGITVISIQPDI